MTQAGAAPRLVVPADDEPNICETLAFMLEREGHTVTQAADGEATLERVRELRRRAVVLDADHSVAKQLDEAVLLSLLCDAFE